MDLRLIILSIIFHYWEMLQIISLVSVVSGQRKRQIWFLKNIYAHLEELTWDIQEKLTAGQEDAMFSKELIKLHVIPELLDEDIAKYTLQPEFSKWKDILVKEYHFASMEKVVDDLKKKYFMPTQNSLF